MYYIIYIVGIILFLLNGIGVSNLSSFRDNITLVLVVIPCLLMLFCTKSFKPFGECFLFTFGKRNYSLPQCRRCLQSVKMVISTAVVSGIICFMISAINMLCSPYRVSGSLEEVGLDLSVAMLSLFYVFIICIMLLPLYFIMKQYVMNLQDGNR